MKREFLLPVIASMIAASIASADIFGTGANQFTIDFVPISGDTGNLGSWSVGKSSTFSGVNHGDYRIGKYEITNAQWTKFKASYGMVTGAPAIAYAHNSYFTDDNVPANAVSWYEAAQFVNYLNTSTGHQAAYKFTGAQGASDYTWDVWSASDTGYNAANPYRNSNAFYFLPTENEWVKAAYWNGISLQTYATKPGDTLYPGNGSNGGWNYEGTYGVVVPPWPWIETRPWAVGSGSQELNGTYDMMGNITEWIENPYYFTGVGLRWGIRGAGYNSPGYHLSLSQLVGTDQYTDASSIGFRVASVPEPCSLALLFLGGLALTRKIR